MTCAQCGKKACPGSCQTPGGGTRPESDAEAARRRRLERGDTLPDVEDEEDDLDADLDLDADVGTDTDDS